MGGTMPIGPNTKIRNNAIHPTTEPADNLSHSDLTQAVDLGGELDAIRSQIKRIIRYDAGGNWYDQQPVFRAQGDTSEFVLQSGVDLKIDDGTIVATGDLTIDDGNRATSTWSEPIKLSTDADEWSALEEVYGGEMSLIAMLHNAASSSTRTKVSLQVNAIARENTLFVPDVDWSGDAANYVDVLLNGQLLRGGTDAQVTAGEVDYAVVGQNGIHFSFDVPEDDFLTFVIMGGDVLGSGGGGGGALGGSSGPAAADTVEAETSFGIAANAGTSASFSRADHTHGTPDIPAHAALSSQGWQGSGHTADPMTVAIFDDAGSANVIDPPALGQREGKFLTWISDTQLGWLTVGSAIIFMFDADPIIDAQQFNADALSDGATTVSWDTNASDLIYDADVASDSLALSEGQDFLSEYDVVNSVDYTFTDIGSVAGTLSDAYNPNADIVDPATVTSTSEITMNSLDAEFLG